MPMDRSDRLGEYSMNGTRMTDGELTLAYQTYRDMVFRIAYV